VALLEKWNPSRELGRLRHEFDELFERFGFEGRHGLLKEWQPASLRPAIESYIDGDKFTVRVELPGVDPKDVLEPHPCYSASAGRRMPADRIAGLCFVTGLASRVPRGGFLFRPKFRGAGGCSPLIATQPTARRMSVSATVPRPRPGFPDSPLVWSSGADHPRPTSETPNLHG
jgi:hypothetical protein